MLGRLEALEQRLDQHVNYYDYDVSYSKDAFNYLAIGNSLTLIDEWDRGICSSRPDNDYVHLIKEFMAESYGNGECIEYAYNFASWERAANRHSTLALIDIYLDEKVDLVTIQLGENVVDLSTYQIDLEVLISYIQDCCPHAQIIVIGDFWDMQKNDLRKSAADNCGVLFADLSQIIGNSDYQSKEGNGYSRAVTPQVRQTGNRLSRPTETDCASLLA